VKMKTTRSSETSVTTYKTTWRHNLKGDIPNSTAVKTSNLKIKFRSTSSNQTAIPKLNEARRVLSEMKDSAGTKQIGSLYYVFTLRTLCYENDKLTPRNICRTSFQNNLSNISCIYCSGFSLHRLRGRLKSIYCHSHRC
jgi:hypothetical protein